MQRHILVLAGIIALSCGGAATVRETPAAPTATTPATPSPLPPWRSVPAPQGAPQGSNWITINSFDGTALIANVVPSGRAGPAPVAIHLHGDGGLRVRNLDLASWLAKEGFIAVTPCWQGYTEADAKASGVPVDIGCSTAAPKRSSAVDLTRDLSAIADAARTLPGARADRVVVIGHSAGGTAAVLAGSMGGRIDSVVSISGPYGTGKAIKGRWGTNAPEQADGLAVPLLIVHGTNDTQALMEAARSYEKMLREKSKTVDTLYVDGAPHELPFTEYWTDAIRAKVIAFLKR